MSLFNIKWTPKQAKQIQESKPSVKRVSRKGKYYYEVRTAKHGTIKRLRYKPQEVKIKDIRADIKDIKRKPEPLKIEPKRDLNYKYSVVLEPDADDESRSYAEIYLITQDDLLKDLSDFQIQQYLYDKLETHDKKGASLWKEFLNKYKIFPSVNRGRTTDDAHKDKERGKMSIYISYPRGWTYENNFNIYV